MIDYIAALVLAALSAWLLQLAGMRSLQSVIDAFGSLVSGWRPDPWPRGVQEEDRDRPWGRREVRKAAPARTEPALKPTLTPVRPRVRLS